MNSLVSRVSLVALGISCILRGNEDLSGCSYTSLPLKEDRMHAVFLLYDHAEFIFISLFIRPFEC